MAATAPKKPFTSDPDVDIEPQDNKETSTNNDGVVPQETISNEAGTIKIGS
jgi:hypothetical protein